VLFRSAEQYAPSSFSRAEQLLKQAKDYYRQKQGKTPIGTVAREAAQTAEEARLMSLNARKRSGSRRRRPRQQNAKHRRRPRPKHKPNGASRPMLNGPLPSKPSWKPNAPSKATLDIT